MFDNFNVNLRKNEGFLTSIPCIPIPEYGQSNAPLAIKLVYSYSTVKKVKVTIQAQQKHY